MAEQAGNRTVRPDGAAPTVSIVIPVYNTARYLERSIFDSVLSQTFSDIEVICVDDGSSDGSAAILDARARIDGRLRVVHRSNAGAAASRNVGLDMARGGCMSCSSIRTTISSCIAAKPCSARRARPMPTSWCSAAGPFLPSSGSTGAFRPATSCMRAILPCLARRERVVSAHVQQVLSPCSSRRQRPAIRQNRSVSAKTTPSSSSCFPMRKP